MYSQLKIYDGHRGLSFSLAMINTFIHSPSLTANWCFFFASNKGFVGYYASYIESIDETVKILISITIVTCPFFGISGWARWCDGSFHYRRCYHRNKYLTERPSAIQRPSLDFVLLFLSCAQQIGLLFSIDDSTSYLTRYRDDYDESIDRLTQFRPPSASRLRTSTSGNNQRFVFIFPSAFCSLWMLNKDSMSQTIVSISHSNFACLDSSTVLFF